MNKFYKIAACLFLTISSAVYLNAHDIKEQKRIAELRERLDEKVLNFLNSKRGLIFNKAFIDQMIPHHRQAIRMSRLVLQHSKNKSLRQLAADMIKMQTEEIEILKRIHDRLN